MLTSIIYSTITTHSSDEVNFYILDFGAETMTMFKKAPHIGEVLLAADAEKIDNLFKMVNNIIEERKRLFVDYNGSFDFYINHGGKQLPLIVVAFNCAIICPPSLLGYLCLLFHSTFHQKYCILQ